ncbi:MAG: hypothetical protein JWM41_3922 [Gemmatimonadetes bacterium]|nr:hypothetical protein [Gemmatimonadota bacterium]
MTKQVAPTDRPRSASARRLVCLIQQPLDARNYERFGIQSWIRHGWCVEVWDLTPFLVPHVWADARASLATFSGYFPIASSWELEERCAAVGSVDYFLDFTGVDRRAIRAKLRLIQLGAIRITCELGSMPEPSDDSRTGFLRRAIRSITSAPAELPRRVIDKFDRLRLADAVKPGLIVVSGRKSARAAEQQVGSDKVISAHNFDYDIFLKHTGAAPTPAATQHAVFLDQDLCFHFDFVSDQVPSYVTPQQYFPAISKGLRTIAGALDTTAVIAAHPRASYRDRETDFFDGIPIQYGKTVDLIRDACVVIGHSSAAIQFAVLFRKPVVFVTTNELAASIGGEYIATFAAALGKSVINLERDVERTNWHSELTIDYSRYADYRNEYVKLDGTPELPLWDIVASRLETDLRARRASSEEGQREDTIR